MPERNSCSPPTEAAPKPAPWKASQKEMVLNRPVAARASFSATSTASDPPVVEQHLGEIARRDGCQLFRQFHRLVAGDSGAGANEQLVHLRGDRLLQARMAVADVVDVVAVEIDIALARAVPDIGPFRPGDGIEAGAGDRLVQEGGSIGLNQRARRGVMMPGGPFGAAR